MSITYANTPMLLNTEDGALMENNGALMNTLRSERGHKPPSCSWWICYTLATLAKTTTKVSYHISVAVLMGS